MKVALRCAQGIAVGLILGSLAEIISWDSSMDHGIRFPAYGATIGVAVGLVLSLTLGMIEIRGMARVICISVLVGIGVGVVGGCAFGMIMSLSQSDHLLEGKSAGYRLIGIMIGGPVGAGCGGVYAFFAGSR
jgi:hypothetical protein